MTAKERQQRIETAREVRVIAVSLRHGEEHGDAISVSLRKTIRRHLLDYANLVEKKERD